MLTNIFKSFFNIKHPVDNKEEINWKFIEIPSYCKILIYKFCVEEFCTLIKRKYPDAYFSSAENKSFAEVIKEAQVLVGWRFPDELLKGAKNLKWIQLISTSASVSISKNNIPSYLDDEVVITSTKGIYSNTVAEYVIWAILTMERKFYKFLKEQSLRKWSQYIGYDLSQKTVGILGLGQIGMAVAVRAKAFGMKVIGIKRNFVPEDALPYVDQVYPTDKLRQVLSMADVIVLCLPLTPETEGLLGIDEMKSMKREAILINVSRGGIVKEDDLIRAIKDKIIAGAVLDVFGLEPLPATSDLWGLDDVIITPHVAGLTDNYSKKVGELVCANLERFIAGKDFINVIDRIKGY